MVAAKEAAAELRKVRVEELQARVAAATGNAAAQREAQLELLRLQSAPPPLRVRRGVQAFAQGAQIHAGGGSYHELRLTLFVATHTDAKAITEYGDDKQTHACHYLFDCNLFQEGLRAVFHYRHLSPDAGAHYTTTAPGRANILDKFLAEVREAEVTATLAGGVFTLDEAIVLEAAKRLYRDAWGAGKKPDGVPPWVPAAVRAPLAAARR